MTSVTEHSQASYRTIRLPAGYTGGRAGARLVLQGLAAERDGSVDQTVEALSRNVARLRRQLTEHHAS